MNIAFSINRLALLGLGATITSVIRHCSDAQRLRFYFLCTDLTEQDKEQIRGSIAREGCTNEPRFIDMDARKMFGAYPSLYQDWTTYGRLLLPDLVDASRVLYLDADLVVEVDVLDLEDFDMGGHAIAAVPDGTIQKTRDSIFYTTTLGLLPEQPAFNAGVLLFDLEACRQLGFTQSCLDLIARDHRSFHSHDQTVLNGYLRGRFAHLPQGFNSIWYLQNGKPTIAPNMVLHFVGSPKPWDALGRWLHDGYPVWKSYTHKDWLQYYRPKKGALLKRTWRMRRAYVRMVIVNIVMYFRNRSKQT